MKTNHHQAGAKSKRLAQSKQARNVAVSPRMALPDRPLPNIHAWGESADANRHHEWWETMSESEKVRVMADCAKRNSWPMLLPLPGVKHDHEFEQRDVLAFLARTFFLHRDSIVAAVRAEKPDSVYLNEQLEIVGLVGTLDAAGIALPETFRASFLPGFVGTAEELTLGDAMFHAAALWNENREVIVEKVWRPLVAISPRLALPIVQAIALAEWEEHCHGGVANEAEMIQMNPSYETAAMFYARWNAELIATQNN